MAKKANKKKEKKEVEENLESELEETSESKSMTEGFVPEITTETPPATLDSTPVETPEPIENLDGLEAPQEGEEDEDREERVYNEPQYGQTNYEEMQTEGERDTEMNITARRLKPEIIDDRNLRRIDFGTWQQNMDNTRESREDYETIKMRRERDEQGLPFEDKRRKYIP